MAGLTSKSISFMSAIESVKTNTIVVRIYGTQGNMFSEDA